MRFSSVKKAVWNDPFYSWFRTPQRGNFKFISVLIEQKIWGDFEEVKTYIREIKNEIKMYIYRRNK